jgi:hypothetical protein
LVRQVDRSCRRLGPAADELVRLLAIATRPAVELLGGTGGLAHLYRVVGIVHNTAPNRAPGRALAACDAHEHTRLAGPAAAEAERRLAEFDEQARLDEQARFAGTVLTDPRRLTRLMRRQDPAIYPGTFATCVFQPDKALCQQHRDLRGATRPGLGECRPLECGNVALTTDNFTALRAELDHIADELAARPSLPPLLAHRLRGRYEQIARFLDRHTPETR